ncbi:MAG: hypothetical protein WKG07_16225 [Hymenobacter sp.]
MRHDALSSAWPRRLWPSRAAAVLAPAAAGLPSVPIDGGVSLLLAAGGAYGLKRLRAAARLSD